MPLQLPIPSSEANPSAPSEDPPLIYSSRKNAAA